MLAGLAESEIPLFGAVKGLENYFRVVGATPNEDALRRLRKVALDSESEPTRRLALTLESGVLALELLDPWSLCLRLPTSLSRRQSRLGDLALPGIAIGRHSRLYSKATTPKLVVWQSWDSLSGVRTTPSSSG